MFGLYQSCWNRVSVGRVSVFWLQGWGVGRGLGLGSGGVVLCLCVLSFSSSYPFSLKKTLRYDNG